MACNTQNVLKNINNLIDRVMITQALSISKLNSSSYRIGYGNSYKVKTRDQAYRVAESKIKEINKRLNSEGYSSDFGPYVQLDTSNTDMIVIHKLNPSKLIRAYELRNQAEQADMELSEYISNIQLEEDLRLATEREQFERDNNLVDEVFDIDGVSRAEWVNGMPFSAELKNNLRNGNQSITIRTGLYSSGIYNTSIGQVQVTNKANKKVFLEELSLKDETLEQTRNRIKNQFKTEELRYEHIQRFFNNEDPMYVYDIKKLNDKVYDIDIVDIPVSEYDSIVNQRKALVSALRATLKRTKDPDKRNVLKERIKRVNDQIEQLENKDIRSFDLILNLAKSDLQVVNNMIDNTVDIDAIGYMTGIISNYTDYLMDNFGNVIDELNPQETSDFNDLMSALQQLANKIVKKRLNIADDKIKQATGKSILDIAGIPIKFKDVGIGSEWALDSTQINNPIVQYITKLVKDADAKIDLAFISFKTKNKKFVDALKKYQKEQGLKSDNYYDFMIQTDSQGKRTKRYVQKYNAEYYDIRSSQQTPEAKFAFWVNNHKFKFNDNAWQERLAIERRSFMDNIADNITLTDSEIDKGITIEEKIESEFNKYMSSRDASVMYNIFIEAQKSGVTNQQIKYFTKYMQQGSFHPVEINGKTIFPVEFEAIDKWIDPKWTAINNMSSTDPRKQFYNHWINNIEPAYKKVSSQDQWLDWSYIPEKAKVSKMGNLRNFTIDSISQNISKKKEIIDPFTNEIKKTIPLFMTGTNMEVEDRSFDLGSILEDFIGETSRFEHMNTVEDDVNLLLLTLKKTEVFKTNLDGSVKIVDGIVQVKEGEDSNIYKIARYRVDAQMYGESQAIEGKTNLKIDSAKTSKRKAELLKELEAIKLSEDDLNTAKKFVYNEEPYIGDNQDIQKFVQLGIEYNKLQNSTRVVTGTKIGNSLLSFTQIRFLGFNLFAGIGEMIQGMYSLNLASAGSKWFTGKDVTNAMGEVIKSMNPGSKSKIRNLAKYFQTASETIMGTDIRRNKLTDAAFFMYKGANYMVNNSYLVAMLMNKKITDTNGKEHRLFDVLNVNNEGTFSFNGSFEEKLYTDAGQPAPYLLQIIQDYDQMLKLNRDRKSSKDPIKMDSTFLGRAVGQFKKNWMINGFLTRFQDFREGNLYDGDRKGFYRSVFDLFIPAYDVDILGNKTRDYSAKNIAKTSGRALSELMKYSFFGKLLGAKPNQELSDLDIANLKMFMRELTWGLSLLTLTAICSAMIGSNDDDENLPFYKYVLNQSTRLLRDVTTYASPSSFMSITKNPMPFMSTVKDIFTLGTKVLKTPMLMSPTYDNSDLQLFKSVENLTPGVRQIRQTYNKINKTINYSE